MKGGSVRMEQRCDQVLQCRDESDEVNCRRLILGILQPLGFLALGLAEDVALGLLLENPSGLQSTPRGRLITLGTALGRRFTWLPPMAFPQIVILSKFCKS